MACHGDADEGSGGAGGDLDEEKVSGTGTVVGEYDDFVLGSTSEELPGVFMGRALDKDLKVAVNIVEVALVGEFHL